MVYKFRKKLTAFFTGILITIGILACSWDSVFSSVHILPRLNNVLYDINIKLLHKRKIETNVVIVDIDEASLAAEGKWPWPRSKFAELVSKLQDDGVAVIAFDILLAEKDVNVAKVLLNYAKEQHETMPPVVGKYLSEQAEALDNDKLLAQILAKGDTVLGVFFHNKTHENLGALGVPALTLPPTMRLLVPQLTSYAGVIPSLMAAAKHSGFVNTQLDEDGVLRRAPMLVEYKHALYPALGLEAARLFLLQDKVTLDTRALGGNEALLGIKLGSTYIPTDAYGNLLVPYQGPAFSFPYISATDVLHGKFAKQTFAGKIVIMGSSAVGIGDVHATPLQASGFPGCEVHANIIDAILNQRFLAQPLWLLGIERILLVAGGFLLSLLMIYCSVLWLFLIVVVGFVAVFLFEAWLRIRWQLILPNLLLPYMMVLLLGVYNMGYGYFFETRYRNRLRGAYGQYVSTEHIDSMLDSPSQYTLEGRSKEMSVLFADVRNFTSISETLDAAGVRNFLNQLFTPLTEIVFNNKGTIDKYVGDMLMAFWNDPLDDPEHEQHAVTAALQMMAKIQEVAPIFAKQGLTNVTIGIGINSGSMHVGDMGSRYRKSYTVLGDAVNLASRLEDANKFYGTNILVSESTKERCHDITFRFIDKVRVKGKVHAINIFEPVGFAGEIAAAVKDELKEHEKALEAYYARDFCTAQNLFTELAKLHPERKLYAIYLERLKEFSCKEPAADWTGEYAHTAK